jgi:Ca2+-binding EF-hand superfamily protein
MRVLLLVLTWLAVVANADEQDDKNYFKDIDTNNDLKVTREEMDTWYMKSFQKKMPEKIWTKHDLDKDGHITWHEFPGPRGDNPHEL